MIAVSTLHWSTATLPDARAGQLFRIAFLMCGDWHEAEDLVQTTLAKLFVAWGRVRRRESVDTYARRVMLNAYLSQRRLRRSGEMPVADLSELSAPVSTPTCG